MITELLKVLGFNSQPISPKNPYGAGYSLHGGESGFVFKCAGLPDPSDTDHPDSPVHHVIGILGGAYSVFVPSNKPQYDEKGNIIGDSDAGVVHESDFTLDPSQEGIDTTTFNCMICGQPPKL